MCIAGSTPGGLARKIAGWRFKVSNTNDEKLALRWYRVRQYLSARMMSDGDRKSWRTSEKTLSFAKFTAKRV